MNKKMITAVGILIVLLALLFPGYALQASVSNEYNDFDWHKLTSTEYVMDNMEIKEDNFQIEKDPYNPNKINIVGDDQDGHTIDGSWGRSSVDISIKIPKDAWIIICVKTARVGDHFLKMTYTPTDWPEITCVGELKKLKVMTQYYYPNPDTKEIVRVGLIENYEDYYFLSESDIHLEFFGGQAALAGSIDLGLIVKP